MYLNNFITEAELKLKKKNLEVKNREKIELMEADYFREEVRKELNGLFGNENLYKEGFIVKTTIDTYYQNIADEAIDLESKDPNLESNDTHEIKENPFMVIPLALTALVSVILGIYPDFIVRIAKMVL